MLQYQETKTLSLADCTSKYTELFKSCQISWQFASMMLKIEEKFCALNSFDKTIKTSPCNGDSGGKTFSFFKTELEKEKQEI